jgi:Uma2 family endonuclease
MSDIVIAPPVDRTLFSLHEEEDVVEIPLHRRQIEYIESNLRAMQPDRFVGGNMGVYWVPGRYKKPWVGPDVLVSQRPLKDPNARVYLVWEDGPIQFVAEVASDRTRRAERPKREQQYRVDLQVPEYLYIDLDRHQLELWRLREGAYLRVSEEGGRLHSRELGVWFGWDSSEKFVRIWTADGQMLLTKEEDWEEKQRVAAERDAARAAEARERARAHTVEAERDAAREQARAAEARAAELAAEIERLRRAAGEGSAEGTTQES